MSFDNLDTDDDVSSDIEEEGGTPEEASNRTFLIVAGVFGAIVVLSLICLVLFVYLKCCRTATISPRMPPHKLNEYRHYERGYPDGVSEQVDSNPDANLHPSAGHPHHESNRYAGDQTVCHANFTERGHDGISVQDGNRNQSSARKASPTVTPKATSLGDTGFADRSARRRCWGWRRC